MARIMCRGRLLIHERAYCPRDPFPAFSPIISLCFVKGSLQLDLLLIVGGHRYDGQIYLKVDNFVNEDQI